jgi:hypothetical protein
MSTADDVLAAGDLFGSPADALRAAEAALDHFNAQLGAGVAGGAGSGDLLVRLERIGAKHTAARAGVLRRFDAADAHDADGYGSTSAWLAAKAGMPRKAAKAAVRQMRQLTERPLLDQALAAGDVTGSLAFTIAGWTRKLPAEMRDETDRILLEAFAGGVSVDDLSAIASLAIEKWRQQQPDPDDPGDRFPDRGLQLSRTFGGAAVLHGDLTPECAEQVEAVLEALGKRASPEDDRTEPQRFHDALQLACALLLRAKLVPDRAGADTQATVLIPISQLREMPGADRLEDAWIRARLGQDGYLTGPDAQAAACDALIIPVVTGTTDPAVIDQMIDLARTAAEAEPNHAAPAPHASQPRSPVLSPEAGQALRYAMTRLAVDLVSGPGGLAATLRRGLLDKPWNTPSQLLDVGYSKSIPGYIRRAVQLRDKHCIWPQCDRPAAHCDIHHLRHQADGGETSLSNCVLLCQFHHDVCIHRNGWTLTLHPDGTTEARSPDGRQILRSHAPPGTTAA